MGTDHAPHVPCAICEGAAKVCERINGIDTGLCAKAIRAACAHATPPAPQSAGLSERETRGASPAARQARQTHCKRGHEFTPENTIWQGRKRACRACDNERDRRIYAAGLKRVGKYGGWALPIREEGPL